MTRIINNPALLSKNRPIRRGAALSNKKEIIKKETALQGSMKIGLAGIMLTGMIIFAGGFYLYQVNSIASEGFEMQDVQNKIQEYQKEGRDLEIKEVESRSMYNIEKSAKDLNLINSSNVSYIELNGPMAMK